MAYEQAKISLRDSQSRSPTCFAQQSRDTNASDNDERAIPTDAPVVQMPSVLVSAEPRLSVYPPSSFDYSSFPTEAEPCAVPTTSTIPIATAAFLGQWTGTSDFAIDFDLRSLNDVMALSVPMSFLERNVNECMPVRFEPQLDFQWGGSDSSEGARMLDPALFGDWSSYA